MSILAQLKSRVHTLSKAETRIAQCILDNPDAMVNITTAELAKLAGVSDPMISRFSRSFGCKSFPEFKVQLAKSLATNNSYISEAVSLGDQASDYIEKRINANRLALDYLHSKLSAESIELAVETLSHSNKIEIFGMGGSAAIAQDAQHKLFRFGIPCSAYDDHLMQRMVSAAATNQTSILMFSFTGRTVSMLEVAEIAQQSGAKVIAVTKSDSPLAKAADICISFGDELEDTTLYVPMTTRIVILTIIDILATGVGLNRGKDIEEHLQHIKHSLDSTKL